jgi:hypothetical protein
MYRTSLSNLLSIYRYFKENPAGEVNSGMWTDPIWNKAKFIAWFRRCLLDKINSRDPSYVAYRNFRKSGDEYRTELMRMSRYVGNRVVIDWIAPVLGPRVRTAFEHRLRGESL